MRFTCVEISLGEDSTFYRYTDVLKSNRCSIKSEEDLSDEYYGWHMEKGFQWFHEYDGTASMYTIAFYESHPFFNCLLLVDLNEKDNSLFGNFFESDERACLPFTKVVEPWIKKVNTNYRRRQKKEAGL